MNAHVAIQRDVCKLLHLLARQRPVNLQFFQMLRFANTKHHAGIMRRQVAPAAGFETRALDSTGCPENLCADAISIT